jgi:hypothetical protein
MIHRTRFGTFLDEQLIFVFLGMFLVIAFQPVPALSHTVVRIVAGSLLLMVGRLLQCAIMVTYYAWKIHKLTKHWPTPR